MTFFQACHTLLDVAKDMTNEDLQVEDFEFVKIFPEEVKVLVRHLENSTTSIVNEPLETCLKAIQLADYLNFQNSYRVLEKEILTHMSESNVILIRNALPKPMFEQLLMRKNNLELVLVANAKHIIPKITMCDANHYAKRGKLLSVKYCLETQGDTLSYDIMDSVSRAGHLPMVQFLHSIGKTFARIAMNWASKYNHLSIIQFLHNIGQDCTVDAMDWASENGHLSAIQFFYSIGKNCTEDAMDCASQNGHLTVVQFLHSINQDCTVEAMDWASRYGHLYIVQFLYSVGKNCSENAMYWASHNSVIHSVNSPFENNNYLSVVQFLRSVSK